MPCSLVVNKLLLYAQQTDEQSRLLACAVVVWGVPVVGVKKKQRNIIVLSNAIMVEQVVENSKQGTSCLLGRKNPFACEERGKKLLFGKLCTREIVCLVINCSLAINKRL